MYCPRCQTSIRQSEDRCPACWLDVGAPNVRAANLVDEVLELFDRYDAAKPAADPGVLTQFEAAVKTSVVVLCRPYLEALRILDSDEALYSTHYQLVGAEQRRPAENAVGRARAVAEELLFPYYKENIRFAALSLDGQGVWPYGDVSLVFRNVAMQDRCSFFHENNVEFAKRRGLTTWDTVPLGYRAAWRERSKLAVAKTAPLLTSSTSPEDFSSILLHDDEFIEAHIYGPLHRNSVERIILKKSTRTDDIFYRAKIEEAIRNDGLDIDLLLL